MTKAPPPPTGARRPRRPDLRIVGWAVVAWVCDRLTKDLAVSLLPADRPVPIVDHVVSFTRIVNAGAAFGILPHQVWLFALVAVAVIAVLVALPRQESGWLALAYGLVAGGAFGNLWDRLVDGAVVDFVDVRFWPGIFNLADACVVVGVCLAVIRLSRR
jgi:signal peptidase II